MKPNPYLATQLSADDWDALLGHDEFTPVDDDEIEALWAALEELEPYDNANSLHVIEARFLLGDVRYRCLWAIHTPSELPFEIAVITPRKRISPEQLALAL